MVGVNVLISTTTISRSLETYTVESPLTATQNGNSPPGLPESAGLCFPGHRSSSAVTLPDADGSVPTVIFAMVQSNRRKFGELAKLVRREDMDVIILAARDI